MAFHTHLAHPPTSATSFTSSSASLSASVTGVGVVRCRRRPSVPVSRSPCCVRLAHRAVLAVPSHPTVRCRATRALLVVAAPVLSLLAVTGLPAAGDRVLAYAVPVPALALVVAVLVLALVTPGPGEWGAGGVHNAAVSRNARKGGGWVAGMRRPSPRRLVVTAVAAAVDAAATSHVFVVLAAAVAVAGGCGGFLVRVSAGATLAQPRGARRVSVPAPAVSCLWGYGQKGKGEVAATHLVDLPLHGSSLLCPAPISLVRPAWAW
ncbi:hypothetical protein BJ912DRAFT_1060033 [Pholiota molesta]|nr:hypothetical protein BJ912DRAFT_1060033 [Pholiota molesta]